MYPSRPEYQCFPNKRSIILHTPSEIESMVVWYHTIHTSFKFLRGNIHRPNTMHHTYMFVTKRSMLVCMVQYIESYVAFYRELYVCRRRNHSSSEHVIFLGNASFTLKEGKERLQNL